MKCVQARLLVSVVIHKHILYFAVRAVPLDSFYPYGASYDDSVVGPTLDGSAPLYLSHSFIYFGVSYDLIYVS